MDIRNKIEGSILIEPVWWSELPELSVELDNELLFHGSLQKPCRLPFSGYFEGNRHRLSVEFLNKKDADTNLENAQDKAVIIREIAFFGIANPKFIWAGKYCPRYPDHMRTSPAILDFHDYLGWNGVWYLDFTTPIFTWMHQVENLGWIYG